MKYKPRFTAFYNMLWFEEDRPNTQDCIDGVRWAIFMPEICYWRILVRPKIGTGHGGGAGYFKWLGGMSIRWYNHCIWAILQPGYQGDVDGNL